MTGRDRHSTGTRALRTGSLVFVATLIAMETFACIGLFPFGECLPLVNEGSVLRLHGNVLNSDTGDGIFGAAVTVKLLTDGESTTRDRSSLLTDEDGAFEFPLRARGPRCASPPDLPLPDQAEVVVTIDGCEQTFLINIGDDTVDLDLTERTIVLKEPILVPLCKQ